MAKDALLATMPGFVEREYSEDEFAGRRWFCIYGGLHYVDNGVRKVRTHCGKNTKVHHDIETARRAARSALNDRHMPDARFFICELVVPDEMALPAYATRSRWKRAGAAYPIIVREEVGHAHARVLKLTEQLMLRTW